MKFKKNDPATFDLITMGRCSIDLYSNDIGAAFTDITSFSSFVGGCPTNVAVGTQRLGLRTALLSAVGQDPVGDFILNFLQREGVATDFIPRKQGLRTSAVLLGIEPPDRFPLVFYRENCADINLSLRDVETVAFQNARALMVTGTGLSRDPSRSATIFAMEQARAHGLTVFLDLDFRADQWESSPAGDARAFGVAIRSVMHLVDIALGTEEELRAAILSSTNQLSITNSQVSAPTVQGDTGSAVRQLLSLGSRAIVLKKGERGCSVHLADGSVIDALPFHVEVCNVLGAGDAFASGFIYSYLKGWDWHRCARMGNATGAIVVTRQGCANFMPSEQEVQSFINSHGGLLAEAPLCLP